MSKTDFKVRDLSSGNGTGGSYSLDLDVNASVAYWNWTGGTAPYGIFRANADGTEFHAVDASNEQQLARPARRRRGRVLLALWRGHPALEVRENGRSGRLAG